MISFSCSCGKKYQLPDRVAGREVRCNQCQKTLTVPKQSQDTPVIPADDRLTEEEKPEPKQPDSVPVTKTDQMPAEPSTTVEANRLEGENDTLQEAVPEEEPKVHAGMNMSLVAMILVAVVIGFAAGIGIMFAGIPATAPPVPLSVDPPEVAPEEPPPSAEFKMPEYSAKDWSVRQEEPLPFAVKTADAKAIRLTPDGNPVEAHKGDKKEEVLNMLGATLSDSALKVVDTQEHNISYRIESESGEMLRFIWPEQFPAELDGARIKAFHLSLYLSEKANSAFKPVKPEGFDKVVEFSEISLRLTADTGYVEYVPVDRNKLAAMVERARHAWLPLQIPIRGDETWKRIDHGLVGPLVVRRIELLIKPTGSGLTFWIDNLGVVE